MKLSIVIPTYNEERHLPQLLASLNAQTFRDFEVIVADANSKDATRDIAAKGAARVVEGGMPGPGRNRGAAAANGEIILFLDADVVLPDPKFLEESLAEFEKKNLAIGTCHVTPTSTRRIDHFFTGFYNRYVQATRKLLPHVPGFCIFVRRDLHVKISGFDESVVFAEDMDYARRAVKHGEFDFLRSHKIPMSVRRFERDGRAQTAFRYVMTEIYMITRGSVKSDLFKYRFGYDKTDKSV